MQTLDRDEASTVVAAPPTEVYAVVADVTRMPDLSPEVVSCRWLDGATGPVVGARFEALNESAAGKRWKNRPVVTVADPGREFAFSRTEPLASQIDLVRQHEWEHALRDSGACTRPSPATATSRG